MAPALARHQHAIAALLIKFSVGLMSLVCSYSRRCAFSDRERVAQVDVYHAANCKTDISWFVDIYLC